MSSKLRYELIDSNNPNLDTIIELYSSAFPPEERLFSLDDIDAEPTLYGDRESFSVYDGDLPVGFYIVKKMGDNGYLDFIAIRSDIRGKGYGKSIMEHILQEYQNKVLFASIERPADDAPDDDIRRRRQRFYERCGMVPVDRRRNFNGVEYILVTNKTGDELDSCYDEIVAEEKAFLDYFLRSKNPETVEAKYTENQ